MSDAENRPVALVTGSTSGNGLAVARRLVHDGYRVVIHSRCSASVGQEIAKELVFASYIRADLAQ